MRQVGLAKIARGRVVLDQPVVTEDAVFTSEPMIPVIVKLDKRSLSEVWRKRTRASLRGVSAGVLVVWTGVEFQGWSPDGEVTWRRELKANPWVGSRQLLVRDSGTVLAIDGATGETTERLPCPEGDPWLIHEDVLLIRGEGSLVHAFHTKDRRVLWGRNLKDELGSRRGASGARGALHAVAAGPGRLACEVGTHVFGLSLVGGECLWSTPLDVHSGIAFRDGRIYLWTTVPPADPRIRTTYDMASGVTIRERPGDDGAENRFVVLDEATGNVVVDRPLAPYGSEFARRMAPKPGELCKNHIAFGTDIGLLVLFRLSDGELVWSQHHHNEIHSPVFDGDRLYVRCADGTLAAYGAEGGEL